MKYHSHPLIFSILVVVSLLLCSSAHAYVFTPELQDPGINSIYLSYNPGQSIGSTIAIDVKMNSPSADTPAFGVAFELDFDPAVLTYEGFLQGDYFQNGDIPENGAPICLVVLQQGATDRLIVGLSQNAGDTGASGSGVIMTLKFTVKSALQILQSDIVFSNMNLMDTAGIVINGISWRKGHLIQTPLSINTTLLPEATEGGVYGVSLESSGGFPPYTWSTSGVVPTGLSLNNQTGEITGMPLTAGVYPLKIQLTDSASQILTKDLTIVVNQTPAISTAVVPEATEGQFVNNSFSASGGTVPLVWSISEGSLPQGVLLDSSTGSISGVPAASGIFAFTVRLEDANHVADAVNLTMKVNPRPEIATTALSDTTVGANYNALLQVIDGTAPYLFTIQSGLPPGLTLINDTGEITGIPGTSGNWQFSVTVRDVNGASASRDLQILVNPVVDIIASSTVSLYQGAPGDSIVFSVSGGVAPYSWNIVSGSLPPGLILDKQTGTVSGLASTPGVYTFTLKITDSTGVSSSEVYTWAILANPPGNVDFSAAGSENRVDGYDLVAISIVWGTTTASPGWNPLADLNSDGIINGADISILQTNFGKSVSP